MAASGRGPQPARPGPAWRPGTRPPVTRMPFGVPPLPQKVVDQFANKSRQQRRKPVRNPHARKLREFLETANEFLAQSAKHRNMARKTLTVDDVDSLRKLKAFCRKSLMYIEQNPEKCRNLEQRIAAAVSGLRPQPESSAGQ